MKKDSVQIDAKDRKIMNILQDNARISNRDLADKLILSQTPCLRRVSILEREGYIVRYKAVIDYRKLGYSIRAFVFLTRKRDSDIGVWEKIAEIPEIISCYIISGDSDLIAEIIAKDMQEYSDILLTKINKIEGIYDARTMFAMKDLKTEGSFNVV